MTEHFDLRFEFYRTLKPKAAITTKKGDYTLSDDLSEKEFRETMDTLIWDLKKLKRLGLRKFRETKSSI